MRTLHTPGPWRVKNGGIVRTSNIIEGNGKKVAVASMTASDGYKKLTELPLLHQEKNRKEIEANARLIASAPDLLSALRNCRDYFVNNNITGSYLNMVEETIAKATGEPVTQ
jgi:hypothetical protein